jgi:hypothetical protein
LVCKTCEKKFYCINIPKFDHRFISAVAGIAQNEKLSNKGLPENQSFENEYAGLFLTN